MGVAPRPAYCTSCDESFGYRQGRPSRIIDQPCGHEGNICTMRWCMIYSLYWNCLNYPYMFALTRQQLPALFFLSDLSEYHRAVAGAHAPLPIRFILLNFSLSVCCSSLSYAPPLPYRCFHRTECTRRMSIDMRLWLVHMLHERV